MRCVRLCKNKEPSENLTIFMLWNFISLGGFASGALRYGYVVFTQPEVYFICTSPLLILVPKQLKQKLRSIILEGIHSFPPFYLLPIKTNVESVRITEDL